MCYLFPAETCCWSIKENKEMKGMMEKSLGNMVDEENDGKFFGNIENTPPFPAETCCGSVKENE